jgi:hypothetical protein
MEWDCRFCLLLGKLKTDNREVPDNGAPKNAIATSDKAGVHNKEDIEETAITSDGAGVCNEEVIEDNAATSNDVGFPKVEVVEQAPIGKCNVLPIYY